MVSRLLAEAEYKSMAQVACEVSWINALLQDFGIQRSKPIPLFCDNNAAIYITSNTAFHERTKHIEIDCHSIRERYIKGLIKPMHVKSELQLADLLNPCLLHFLNVFCAR